MSVGWSFYNDFWNYGDGSNLRTGTNPAYATTDFLNMYPQFGNDSNNNPVIQPTIIQSFIDIATASLNQSRWRSAWNVAMGLFIAHLCTLYLQSSTAPGAVAQTVAEAGRAQGMTTSESVGDVSTSSDTGSVVVDGWGAWNLTIYGQQLATLAKVYGMGGMQIW